MIAPAHRRPNLTALLLVLGIVLTCAACEEDQGELDQPAEESTPQHRDLRGLAEAVDADLTVVDESLEVDLRVGGSTMYPRCHELLEEEGQPLAMPLDDDEVEAGLFGCGVVGSIRFDDRRLALAYEIPMEGSERATDLRVVVYDAHGEPLWHQRLDRSHQRPNFTANHRSSYFTAVGDRMVCAGTRWTSNTQLMCASLESGNVHYQGHLSFVAGLDFFGFDGSLFSADSTGITRRYPFTGAEMRHRAFGARGGRAGFYATDEQKIFFVPSEGDPVLSAWDLEDLRPLWTADLDEIPNPRYFSASDKYNLLLFLLDETLAGVDTVTGELRFAFYVGESRPEIAYGDEALFILVRHADVVPTLSAVDPEKGDILWSAPPPTGSLTIAHIDGELLVRSVRTVRPVTPAGELAHE